MLSRRLQSRTKLIIAQGKHQDLLERSSLYKSLAILKWTISCKRKLKNKGADEVIDGWDNGGIMQDLHAHFRIGVKISDSDVWPKWAEGNEFQAIRQASQNL